MGFPVSYPEVLFPKPFLHALAFLWLIRSLLVGLFDRLGLADFLENDVPLPDAAPPPAPTLVSPLNAHVIRERLPVVKFEDVAGRVPAQESCAVCLCEFEGGAEVRWLSQCRHIFHRHCMDRWMDLDQRTCPLCRTPFVDAWTASINGSGPPPPPPPLTLPPRRPNLYDILE